MSLLRAGLLRGALGIVLAGALAAALLGAARMYPGLNWAHLPMVGLFAALWAGGMLLLSLGALRLSRRRFLIVTVAGAAALRLGWSLAVPHALVSDFAVYHELAAALAAGQGFSITGPVGIEDIDMYIGAGKSLPYTTAFRAPGTSLWGGLLYALAGVQPAAFQAANALLGALQVWLLFGLTARWGPRVARSAALLWAVYPSAIFASSLVCSEVLFTTLLLAAARLWPDGRAPAWRALAAGLAAGACVLVRPLLWPILAAAALVSAAARGRRGGAVASFLAFAAGVFLAVSPWTARNWLRFGRLVPVCTEEGIHLGWHTRDFVPESAKDEAWRRRYLAWDAIPDEAAKASSGYGLAARNLLALASAGPGAVARRLAHGFAQLFAYDGEMLRWSVTVSAASIHDASLPFALGRRTCMVLALGVCSFYALMLGAALAGVLLTGARAFRRPDGLAFLAVLLLVTTAIHALIGARSRYHFALMPLVLALAARAHAAALGRRR